jgi:diguanylate cyclase (GGDEF)-like protein/PAS domain S-box-containing protein
MVPFQVPEESAPRARASLGAAEAARISGELAGAEDHSRLLIEQLTQAVFETGPGGYVTERSPSWMAYTGQSFEEAKGFGWIDAIHPDDRAEIARLRKQARENRTDLNGEFRLRRADGGWCWTNIRAVPLFDEAGEIVKWVGMNIDVSGRREAEAMLAEAQDDLRGAAERNPQMSWVATGDGRILSMNDRWCEFIGKTPEEACTARLEDFAHPDDIAAADAQFFRCIATGDPFDARFRVRTPERGWRWVRSRAWSRTDANGKVIRWYGFTEDIHEAVLAEAEIRAAEERYRLVAQATHDVIWDFDLEAGMVTWSDALESRFGLCLDGNRADKRWWIRQIHPDDRARVIDRVAQLQASSDVVRWTNEYRFARADGSYADVLDRGQIVRNAEGKPMRAIGAMLDLSEKKRAEDALRVGAERLRLAVTASGLGISDYDVETDTLHWSAELRAILGIGADEPALAATAHALVHPDDRAQVIDQDQRARDGDFSHQYRGVWRIFRSNDGALRWVATHGHPIYDDSGALVRILVTAKDVTDEKTAQDRLHWTATHDAVTGLPNRAAFQTSLDSALTGAITRGTSLALLLFDLDNFKQINDGFGHHAGDVVLRTFGDRVGEVLPPGAVLARFGGDEFAVILPGTTADASLALADDLLAILRRPLTIDGNTLDLRASAGIAIFPEHGINPEELVKSADIALYAAKAAGRATVSLFAPEMRSALQEHATMLTQARSVVDNAWTHPFYQPKIALNSGRVMGFEALFRWRHPQSGVQGAATIAGAFDDFELASVLGEAMVEAVLGDVRRWLDARIDIGRVALNASAAEFRNPHYAERLLSRLDVYGVPATALELEITETAFLADGDGHVLHALETLRAAGMTIALDDFGTGFSSLAHLRRFPVDTLKIDQSFVSGLEEREGDRAIVEVVLRLGEALRLTTVAEGVETESQASFLRGRGCKLAQGYLFARPLPASEVAGFVAGRGMERRGGERRRVEGMAAR